MTTTLSGAYNAAKAAAVSKVAAASTAYNGAQAAATEKARNLQETVSDSMKGEACDPMTKRLLDGDVIYEEEETYEAFGKE